MRDAAGNVPPHPLFGMFEAASNGAYTAGPLNDNSQGEWSGTWWDQLTGGNQVGVRARVSAPGYVTAAITGTVPCNSSPQMMFGVQVLRKETLYGAGPKYLIRDQEAQLGTAFDQMAKATGIAGLRIPFQAPLVNATGERFLERVRREGMNQLLIFSERQLDRVIQAYVEHFHRVHPHKG